MPVVISTRVSLDRHDVHSDNQSDSRLETITRPDNYYFQPCAAPNIHLSAGDEVSKCQSKITARYWLWPEKPRTVINSQQRFQKDDKVD